MQSLLNNPTPQSIIKEWREDSAKCIQDLFKCELEPWQLKVCADFDQTNKIAMKACKGPGKTFLLSCLTWAFVVTRPNAEVMCLSITYDNLKDYLWKELNKRHEESPLLQALFVLGAEKIYQRDHKDTWYISARAYKKDSDTKQQASSIAGFHAEYGMTVMDETGDMPASILPTVEASLTSGREMKIIMAGNPSALDGVLYQACENGMGKWKVTEINSDPDNPDRSRRVSAEWARGEIDKYGRESDYVRTNILGKFPGAGADNLLSMEEVMRATKLNYTSFDIQHDQRRLGVDVARQGDDRTVIIKRQGKVAYMPTEYRELDSVEVADKVYKCKADFRSDFEFIDGTGGYGAGVVDNLVRLGLGPIEVHFSSKPTDSAFLNKRSEMWFRMAEWVKNGGSIPNHPDLIRELVAPKIEYRNGKMKLEDKESIKKRLGFSPDIADALALTFAMPDMPVFMEVYHAKTD